MSWRYPLGCRAPVTLIQTILCGQPDDDEGIEQVNPIVGTTNKSMAAMSGAWLRRRFASLAGRPPRLTMYLATPTARPQTRAWHFAVNAWRPKVGSPCSSVGSIRAARRRRRSPSQWARLPTPVAAKAGPVPTHERLGLDDRENLQD